MYKVVVTACLLVAVGLALAVYLGAKASPGEFTFNNHLEVNALDPHVISWKHDIRIANALFEGLMAFEVLPPARGARQGMLGLTSGVAERFEVSDDGLIYTFTLRDDALWSNGQPVTAEDFRWSWQRVMTPQTGADYAGLMFVIAGARDYYRQLAAGEDADFAEVGVQAVDERTLKVTLAAPCGYFLELTAFPTFFPVWPPLLAEHVAEGSESINGIARYDLDWTKPGVLVNNGPFTLVTHLYKDRIELARNERYWDRESVKLNHVTALAIEDNTAGLYAYESGRCDFIDSLPPAVIRQFTEQGEQARRSDYYRSMSFGTYFYRFNCQAEADGRANPLVDPRVRRALAMAVDKDDIIAVAGAGQPRADSFIPPGLTVTGRSGEPIAYQSRPSLAYNPEVARRLLAEAGYPGGEGLGVIRLMYNTGAGHEPVAQRLASIWRAELGAEVELDPKDGNAFGEALKKPASKEWHIGRSGWFGDYRDPSTFLEMFTTGDGNNDCGYSNPRFDAWMKEAASIADQRRRMELFAQAEHLATQEEAAVLPLYHYVEHYMIRPHVRGAWPNQMGYTLLKQISVER